MTADLWQQAIGQRNRVDSEIDNRNRQKLMLELLIKEKQTELERSGFSCLAYRGVCAHSNDAVLLFTQIQSPVPVSDQNR